MSLPEGPRHDALEGPDRIAGSVDGTNFVGDFPDGGGGYDGKAEDPGGFGDAGGPFLDDFCGGLFGHVGVVEEGVDPSQCGDVFEDVFDGGGEGP